jgi:hypothetical protein
VWYVGLIGYRVPSSRRQVGRGPAERRVVGAVVFGGVLGIGFLTVVVTPFVWVGVFATFASGAPALGAIYGAAFGAGRSASLIREYFADHQQASAMAIETIVERAQAARIAGVATSVVVLLATVLK